MVKDDQNPVEETQEENAEVVSLKQQVEEADSRWKRALADYQNLEKRTQEEKMDFVRFSAKKLIEKLLGVLDDLEKAHAHLKDKGLELAVKKLVDVLKQEGVERIETVGKEYDIETMEALTLEEGKDDNKVLEEFRPGYTMYGSVLRPAQVKVSKKSNK